MNNFWGPNSREPRAESGEQRERDSFTTGLGNARRADGRKGTLHEPLLEQMELTVGTDQRALRSEKKGQTTAENSTFAKVEMKKTL